MIKKLTAFTLAETLIVMGIIGVVAALTVPNLNASTGEKEKVAKVKKIYKDLNDAYGRAVAIYGPVDEWFLKDTSRTAQSTRFAERLLDFMKVSKNCGTSNNSCVYNGYYSYLSSGANIELRANSIYKIITSDGTSIAFDVVNINFGLNSALSCPGPYCQYGASIYVDVDGPSKGAHATGKDMFQFFVDKEFGIIPTGGQNFNIASGNTLSSYCFYYGTFCAGWVIETGNMDYLKATNGTCPNGTVLSWTNTSCK